MLDTSSININIDDYLQLVREYNPYSPIPEQHQLIQNYKTPSREYMYHSSKNLNIHDAQKRDLQHIIQKCFMCSIEERYQACIVWIYKMSTAHREFYLINRAKDKLIQYIINPPQIPNKTTSTSYSICPCCKSNIRLSICN